MDRLPRLLFRTLLLCVLIFAGTSVSAAMSRPIVDNIRPPLSVRSMAVDREGFLWLGGLRMLSRFDGISSTAQDQGIPFDAGAWVISLAATQGGELYAAISDEVQRPIAFGATDAEVFHTNSTILRRFGDQWVPINMGTEDPHPVISSMIALKEQLWIAAAKGLIRFADNKATTFDPKTAFGSSEVTALAAKSTDAIWVGGNGAIAKFNGNAFIPVAVPGIFGIVSDIALASDGSVWAADEKAVYHLAADGKVLAVMQASVLQTETQRFRLHLHAASDKSLWLGSRLGLLQLDATGAVLSRYGFQTGILDAQVLSLWEDGAGGIWAGTKGRGVVRFRQRRAESANPENGWPTFASVTTVDNHGIVWVAGRNGIFWRNETGGFTLVPQGTHRIVSAITGIAVDTEGGVLVSTGGQGVFSVSKDAVTAIVFPDLGAKAHVSFAWSGAKNGTWLGLNDGAVWKLDRSGAGIRPANPSQVFSHKQGLCAGVPRNAAAARDGGVWVALEGGGLGHIVNGVASCPFPATEHQLGLISSVLEDEDGTLWIGLTHDAGLLVKKADLWLAFSAKDGLHCDSIHEVIDDGHGSLWLPCAGGIQRVSKSALLNRQNGGVPVLSVMAFAQTDGLLAQETAPGVHPIATLDNEDRLWLATTLGPSVINPPSSRAHHPAHPILTDVLINGKSVGHKQQGVVPGRSATVEFRFSMPNLVDEENNVFAYILDGKDPQWRKGMALSNHLLYADLRPGNYALRLRALASDDKESPEAIFRFSIVTPLTDRIWFWVTLFFVATALVVAVFRVRLLRARKRFVLLHAARARIARDLHDLIGQSFSSVGLHLDAARRVARLGAGDPMPLLDTARQMISLAKKDLRRAIWDLRTERINVPPLRESLGEVVDRHAKNQRGQRPKVLLTFNGNNPPRSSLHEFELVQIADEAIWNAIKHSEANNIQVTVKVNSSSVTLTVSDDGLGFSAETTDASGSGHFGIVGMYERAQRIGATMNIRPAVPSGTEVYAEVPVSEWNGTEP